MHVDGAGVPHHGRALALVEQPRHPRPPGRAQHELRRVDPAGEVEQRRRHVVADHGVERGTHLVRQLPVLPQVQRHERGQPVRVLDVHHQQLRARPRSDPAAAPDQRLALRPRRDRDDDPLTRLPRFGDPLLGAVPLQRHVHLVCHPQQRQLAQRGQVAGPEVVAQRGVDPLRGVDVAVRQAAAQRLGREVDQLDLLGSAHHLVGHRLLLRHPGDLLDDVVEALQVLHVDGGQHVDARGEQLLDVLPALLVARTGDVGVREFVHNGHFGPAGEDRVDIQLGELAPTVHAGAPRHDLDAVEERGGLGAAVRLDEPGHDVGAALQPPPRLAQHREGLADAGRRPEVDPQLSPGRPILLSVHGFSVPPPRRPRGSAPARSPRGSRCRPRSCAAGRAPAPAPPAVRSSAPPSAPAGPRTRR